MSARRAVRMTEATTHVKPIAYNLWCLPVGDRANSGTQIPLALQVLQLHIPTLQHQVRMHTVPRPVLHTVVTLLILQCILFQTVTPYTLMYQNHTAMDATKSLRQAQRPGRIWPAMHLQLWPLSEAWACMTVTICSALNATKAAMEERVFGVYYVVVGDFSPHATTHRLRVPSSKHSCKSTVSVLHIHRVETVR